MALLVFVSLKNIPILFFLGGFFKAKNNELAT